MGDVVSITGVVAMSDGSSVDLYWDTDFRTNSVPFGLVPPGSLAPRSGGPISSGTKIELQYRTTEPVDAEVAFYVSTTPRVSRGSGRVVSFRVR